MEKLLSYKGDKKLKERFVAEIEKHKKADAILQGTYGKENGHWKGCAVACSVRSLDIIEGKELKTECGQHERYETSLGIPEWLARLEDTIFEGLPVEESKKWVIDFAKAIPVGVNLESVKYQFCAFILKENIDRVLRLKISDALKKEVVKTIQGVLMLHENAIKTGEWDKSAESAVWSAVWSAAWSAVWSAAWSAAWSAESAVWSAVWSAARSAAWSAASAASAAESAAYKKYAKELLMLLENAK